MAKSRSGRMQVFESESRMRFSLDRREHRLGGHHTPRVRGWLRALILACASVVAAASAAHPLSVQECFEGGDFIAHAAEARDNGVTKAEFVARLVADVYLIQAFPRELRWFVLDPEDAEFLESEASQVFDRPLPPEAQRASFLSRCFER
jgi:hypothetical protein